MRYQSGDLLINWTDEPSPAPGMEEARGTLVDNSNPARPVILWTFYGIHYPSFWTPARVAQEILDWSKPVLGWQTLIDLTEIDQTDFDELRFAVKEAV